MFPFSIVRSLYAKMKNAKLPNRTAHAAETGTIALRILPSAPEKPVVEIPMMTHPGAKASPRTPPTVCSATVTAGLTSRIWAAVLWKFPNRMLDDMLLLVMKDPNIPKNGAAIT